MTVKDQQQVQRAYSLPPQHLNNPKPRKVTHSTPSQTIPGDIMRRRELNTWLDDCTRLEQGEGMLTGIKWDG